MAARPADSTTTRHPKGGRYFGCVVGGARVSELTAMVACPRCGRPIADSASYCDRCRKAAAS
jgi:predicted RNA-binding Zn-ribbon protein involved in translation (DUF1610 family)